MSAPFDPRKHFSKAILEYKVKTRKLGVVRYANLDNAATTPPLVSVDASVREYLESYGSIHRGAGTKSKVSTLRYEESREALKKFVHAPSDSYVLFSGNTTGSMNMLARFLARLEGDIMVSSVEHSASWIPFIVEEGLAQMDTQVSSLTEVAQANDQIQKLGRTRVVRYHTNEHFEFDLTNIESILRTRKIKALVLTASSNITGYAPDIRSIGALAHKYGAYFVVDACQYIQHHEINMRALGIDFLAASGHKMYAPYGGGLLIGPKKFFDAFLPYQMGGGTVSYITEEGEFMRYYTNSSQDPGTPNAVGAVAMACAARAIQKIGFARIQKHESQLAQQLYTYLISNPAIEVFVKKEHLSTVVPFAIRGMDPIVAAERLYADYGIGVRAGAFCVYHVLRTLMGITDERAIVAAVRAGDHDAVPKLIRASVGLCTMKSDIDRLIRALEDMTRGAKTSKKTTRPRSRR